MSQPEFSVTIDGDECDNCDKCAELCQCFLLQVASHPKWDCTNCTRCEACDDICYAITTEFKNI